MAKIRISKSHLYLSHGYTHRLLEGPSWPYSLSIMPRRARTSRNAAHFGAIIRRLRDQRGWTLIDFGRKANMNPTYLGFVERGQNSPTLDTVILLAKVLGTEASDLLREMEQQK
jgi:ribosome-binding protein aMBF1 (putative translation factor)